MYSGDRYARCGKCGKQTKFKRCPRCNGRGRSQTTQCPHCSNTGYKCENGLNDRYHS